MKKHAMVSKALLVMLLFLLVSTAANVNAFTLADDDDGTDDTTTETTEDEHENEDDDSTDDDSSDDDINDRTLQVQVMDFEAEIESKLTSGENEDSFKVRIHADDGLEFKVSYEIENVTTETEHEFEITFEELVEYIDSNGNGVYDDEVDDDVQTMELNSFNPILYTVENGTNGDIHVFEVSTTDGVFSVQTFATGEFESVNGTLVAPTQMKIDIIINDFNYTEDNSQLALKIKLEASTETSYEDVTEDEEDGRATDEAEVSVDLSQFDGFFSWKENAEIDGVTYSVNSSIDEVSLHEKKIYLNYVRGNQIIHDPKVGFENVLLSSSGSGTSPPFGDLGNLLTGDYLPITMAAIGAIAIIGILFVVRRRS